METFPFESIKGFTFKTEPMALPAELRPMHKIGLILLFLRLNSAASTSSILKIQFLNWVLKTEDMKAQLINGTDGKEATYLLKVVHLDPAVNRAVQYAIAENLIALQKTGKIKLTDSGINIADKIIINQDLFLNEKEYLKKLGKRVSDVQIKNVLLG
jgi:predicted nucleic acid binding AN1-type Zn finger protein